MPVLLLCLVIVGVIFLLCYAAWYYGRKKKIDPKVVEAAKESQTRNQILETIYMGAGKRKVKPGTETLKISLLEKLNISPATMRKCLDDLFKKKLIIESKDAVSLTTFGVEHYEVFVREPKPKAKKK